MENSTLQSSERREAFEFASRAEHLAEARDFVKRFATDCGFNKEDVYDIVLAVGEASTNSIEHGSPRGEKSVVRIVCRCTGGQLVVEVADEGVFRKELPEMDGDSGVSYRGRGIFLMLALMDKVSIDESKKGTTVYLSKRLVQA